MLQTRNSADASPRAFSILELLVCIMVIATLAAILLPALMRTRDQARQVSRLSDLRQLVMAMSMYTEQASDRFPTITSIEAPRVSAGWLYEPDPVWPQTYFVANSTGWTDPLQSLSFDLPLEPEIEQHNLSAGNGVRRTLYRLTQAAHAGPNYWRDPLPPAGTDDLTTQQRSAVRYPSSKGLLIALHDDVFNASSLQSGVLAGLGDGSAVDRTPRPDSLFDRFSGRHGAVMFPVLGTRDGLDGRDF